MATLGRNWWALLIRGIAALLFGVLTFVWPAISLVVLVFLFGAYAFVDGVLALIAAAARREVEDPRWLLALEGVVGILAGIAAFVWPGMTALVLLYIIAAWAVVTGIIEVATAMRLRREISGEWALILARILSVLFGAAITLFPGAGALAVVLVIGAYAILFGILMIVLAFRLRRAHTFAGAGF
jgi:uncharacterized membrane protein HdeD (DUF308 family)